MAQFRKKPVVIEAVQYVGNGNLHPDNHGAVPDWMWEALQNGGLSVINGTGPMIIKTLEGELTVTPGDWIIKGIKGELYPCKPDIFAATYEPV